jgi:tRNA nucleotidyltransferase (CCA-adding enzyme)
MGRHLLTMGISPGPEMGKHLDDCYEAQLDGLFTTLDEGLAYARRILSPAS